MFTNHDLDIKAITEKIGSRIKIVTGRDMDQFYISTPFTFTDGDHIVIILEREGPEYPWILSDEGHTYMHLTYDSSEKNMRQGLYHDVIKNILVMFNIEDRNGELILHVINDQFDTAIYSFIEALVRIIGYDVLSCKMCNQPIEKSGRT